MHRRIISFFFAPDRDMAGTDLAAMLSCRAMLSGVSRSFTQVIPLLPSKIEKDVTIFYLVLRALDTIEDDMTLSKTQKLDALTSFPSYWKERGASAHVPLAGAGHERSLLQHLDRVKGVYDTLPSSSRETIADTCERMSAGMRDFIGRDTAAHDTISVPEYHRYCHIAAGLVGEGLTHIFVRREVESESLLDRMESAHALGVFLQKVNIIRDVCEDTKNGRHYWPREWKPDPGDTEHARLVHLERMADDAMQSYTHAEVYLRALQDARVFRFCAVSVALAHLTLDLVRGDPRVYSSSLRVPRAAARTVFEDSALDWDSYRNHLCGII